MKLKKHNYPTSCTQVVLHLNEQIDGQKVERVKFLLSEMETEVEVRSWDLSVTASIGSAETLMSERDGCVGWKCVHVMIDM